jgi:hypothetical protein
MTTLEEEMSVTNPYFIVDLFRDKGLNHKGILHALDSKNAWIVDLDLKVKKKIIETEGWFRNITYDCDFLVDFVGRIGSGKSTLMKMVTQSAGGLLVPAHVRDERGEILYKSGKPILIPKRAAMLAELMEDEDVFPEGFSWSSLPSRKETFKIHLEGLYDPLQRLDGKHPKRIQDACFSLRRDQASAAVALQNYSDYNLPVFRDGSPLADRYIFVERFAELGWISPEDLVDIDLWLQTTLTPKKPAIIFQYECSAEEAYAGTLYRKREVEMESNGKGIGLEYIQGFDSHFATFEDKLKKTGVVVPVVEIERSDFPYTPKSYINILKKIGSAIEEVKENE